MAKDVIPDDPVRSEFGLSRMGMGAEDSMDVTIKDPGIQHKVLAMPTDVTSTQPIKEEDGSVHPWEPAGRKNVGSRE